MSGGATPVPVAIRPYDASTDEPWATGFIERTLGGREQARRHELIDVLGAGIGFIADLEGDPVGLLTYRVDQDAIELTAIAAEPTRQGIGSALVSRLETAAREAARDRIWVVTTNDNLGALAFYQRRGFRLREVRIGAVDDARRDIKPAIPILGEHGIPMHDEIELERAI